MNIQQSLARWEERLRMLREQAAAQHPTDQSLPLQLSELEGEMGKLRATLLKEEV